MTEKKQKLTCATPASPQVTYRNHYTPKTNNAKPAQVWADRMRELHQYLHTGSVVATVSADDTIALTAFLDGYKSLVEGAADDAPDADFERQFKALARQAVDVAERIEAGGIRVIGCGVLV